MSTAKNKRSIQQVYAELSQGRAEHLIEKMAEDIRWTVIGTTKFSGTLTGKQNVIDNLFSRVASELDGPTEVTIKNIIAEGDHVVVESSGQARTRSGRTYNNTYCEIYRFSNGKIEEVTLYLDTALIEEVFGRGTK